MSRRHRKVEEQEPTPFPGFREITEIGGGAFATVYRAVEEGTERPVALKLLKVGGIQAALLESFDAELRALALVSSHPHIVTLYRPFTASDGRPALVLELCTESYAQRIRSRGPRPAAEVLAVGIKIAGALETAHRAGFLHRDMKPQNILVTQFGEPALADFGVAALQASAQATEGVFGFTTLHAPPEVLEGAPLSAATDVYGLASTLYQVLTGKAPFAAFQGEAPAAVILRILRDPVRPVTAADVPVALSDLLGAALAKDPGDRPPDAAAFADALRDVEAGAAFSPTPYVVVGEVGATQPEPTAPTEHAVIDPGDPAPRTLAAPRAAPVPAPLPDPPPAPSGPARGRPVPGVVTPVAGERRVVAPPVRPGATSPPPAPPTPPPTPPPAVAPPPTPPPPPAVAPPPTPPPPTPSPPVPPARPLPDLGRPVPRLDRVEGTSSDEDHVRPPAWAAPEATPWEQTVIPGLDGGRRDDTKTPTPARAAALRAILSDDDLATRARRTRVLVGAAVAALLVAALILVAIGVL